MTFRSFVLTAAASLMLLTPAAALAGSEPGDSQEAVATAAPARQSAVVWFMRPVLVGRQILQGQYIIEHDNDRQARGEPCTHIYAANNRKVPVVTFHCTHLDRPTNSTGTVSVYSTGDISGLTKLEAFQFAGDSAAHGYPSGR